MKRAPFYIGIISALVLLLGTVGLYLYRPAEFDILMRAIVFICIAAMVLGYLESVRQDLNEKLKRDL